MGSCCASRAIATRHIEQSIGVGDAAMLNNEGQASKGQSNSNRKSDKTSSKFYSGKDS